MRYSGINKCDSANGPGLRVSLFVSGCTLKCKGCFNKETWDFNYGREFTDETIKEVLDAVDNPYVHGLSILGGDPFERLNMPEVYRLISEFRHRFGDTKSIWVWTGRKFENLLKDELAVKLFNMLDTIVDGPYIEKYKAPLGSYFGSTNQRVIDLKSYFG